MARSFIWRTRVLALASVVLVGGFGWYFYHWASLNPRISFDISPQAFKGWISYGGSWELVNGSIHNNSAERGPKLMTGSSKWADYTLMADIQLDGNHGDMGVIIRSNDEEEGGDAYRGYYAGLRYMDSALVVGRADHGWLEARPVPMPGGVLAGTWYRLTVTAFHCWIAATAQNLTTRQSAWLVMEENPCITSGRIGLRSYAIGGSWRNLSVAPSFEADITQARRHVDTISHPDYPVSETTYNHLFPLRLTRPMTVHTVPATAASVPAHIGDLLNLEAKPEGEVVLRGVVTLTSPALYLQDSTGGILVESPPPLRLNTGEVVEVHGVVKPGPYSASIRPSFMRRLWNGTPASPISVTPAQAASGSYDARLVEIEGKLISDKAGDGGPRILTLTDGIQTFSAFAARRSGVPLRPIDTGSTLRVRGVCVLGKSYTNDLTPFVVLLPSESNIQIVSDPPWWNPWHESLLFAAVLTFALLVQVAYFRLQRWKTQAITRERERLAHEMHDTMAQGFAGVGYQIQGIHKMVAAGKQVDRAYIAEQLRVAYQLVHRSHEEASRAIAMLAPQAPIAPDKLLDTLADAVTRIAGDAIKVTTHIEGAPSALPLRMTNALFHIGREAAVNAAAHGRPAQIVITLRVVENKVAMTIEDDGHGFQYTPEVAGFGILGMQKRTRDIAGKLDIRSTPGTGTVVSITAYFPVAAPWSRIANLVTVLRNPATKRRRR